MPKSDLRIDLLGTSFTIAVDEDAFYLKVLLERYRRVIDSTQKTTGIDDPLKTAILAGLLLCDEAEKLRARENTGLGVFDSMQAETLTRDLIDRIDKALPPGPASQNEQWAVSGITPTIP